MSAVKSPRELGRLRCVSAVFRDVIDPVLFEQIYIKSERDVQGLNAHGLSGHRLLKHVRKVSVLSIEARSHKWPYELKYTHALYRRSIEEVLLPQLPQLTSFRWAARGSCEAALVALEKLCPNLTSLDIMLDRGFRYDNQGPVQVPIFKCLESLTIYNVSAMSSEDLTGLLLVNAGTLRSLHLSLQDNGHPFYFWGTGTTFVRQPMISLLDTVDVLYAAAKPSAPPLALQRLVLGSPFGPDNKWTLPPFVDPKGLEEVYISNYDPYPSAHVLYRDTSRYMYQHNWRLKQDILRALSPDRCPDLQYLGVDGVDRELLEAFAEVDLKWTSRIALVSMNVNFSKEAEDERQEVDDNTSRIKTDGRSLSPRLRVMAIDLCSYPDTIPRDEILSRLLATDDGTLEGLRVQMAMQTHASGEGEFVDLDLILHSLSQLRNLQQLVLHSVPPVEYEKTEPLTEDCCYGAKFLAELAYRGKTRLCGGCHQVAPILLRSKLHDPLGVAMQVASTIQTLRYLHLAGITWRIWRTGPYGQQSLEEDTPTVRLEELEECEVQDIDLFRVMVMETKQGVIWDREKTPDET
ncbi:hypothetical protein SEUCBS140593_008312 [Sporothrix eucalyptigena]|uniref:F-box domain-containing protein n=1 Tax=Sporothrix eucalyptigena TaxID=1812306 RepID=A0ABP0CN22_9PEZI